jgi:class 3 adenylate cyclase
VLFCDLVGSTAITSPTRSWGMARLRLPRIIAPPPRRFTRFGGHVAKYLGDGVMAFHGYPEAHDNDAERVARAGLATWLVSVQIVAREAKPKTR